MTTLLPPGAGAHDPRVHGHGVPDNSVYGMLSSHPGQTVSPVYRPFYVTALTVAFLLYALVGVDPWPGDFAGDTSEGSPLSRLVFLGLMVAGLPILWERRNDAYGLLLRNWLMLLVLGWLMGSMLWSEYPGLTLRRAGFLIVGFLIALAVAVGTDDPKQFLKTAAITLFGVLFINLASVFVVPHLAVEELGARGMHPQKNTAGSVAMLGFVILTIAAPTVRSFRGVLMIAFALAVTLLFLILTKSKTSLALAVLFVLFVMPIAIGLARGRVVGLVLTLTAGFFASAAFVVIGAMGWDFGDVLLITLGDRTFTGRTDIWEFAALHISQSPMLGTGYGAFWDVGADANPLRNATSWLRDVELGVINQTHNGYIDLWLQAGLPAMIGGIALMLRGLWVSGRLLVLERDGAGHWTGPGLIFGMLGILTIYNLMESALLSRVHFLSNVIFLLLLLADRWSMRHAQRLDAALQEAAQAR